MHCTVRSRKLCTQRASFCAQELQRFNVLNTTPSDASCVWLDWNIIGRYGYIHNCTTSCKADGRTIILSYTALDCCSVAVESACRSGQCSPTIQCSFRKSRVTMCSQYRWCIPMSACRHTLNETLMVNLQRRRSGMKVIYSDMGGQGCISVYLDV